MKDQPDHRGGTSARLIVLVKTSRAERTVAEAATPTRHSSGLGQGSVVPHRLSWRGEFIARPAGPTGGENARLPGRSAIRSR
ncbi:hypothetical protein J6590_031834 [Homalodisca vitripennis]|nr:hypothetical protein J6590_031834 [Homalodisca vitripennis]